MELLEILKIQKKYNPYTQRTKGCQTNLLWKQNPVIKGQEIFFFMLPLFYRDFLCQGASNFLATKYTKHTPKYAAYILLRTRLCFLCVFYFAKFKKFHVLYGIKTFFFIHSIYLMGFAPTPTSFLGCFTFCFILKVFSKLTPLRVVSVDTRKDAKKLSKLSEAT